MSAEILSSSRPRFNADEKRILRFTGVAHLLTHFVELSYPTLAVALAAETGLPLERVLGWSLGGYLLFGLGAIPAGYAADRFGESVALIHADIGSANADRDAQLARAIAEFLPVLLRPGGLVVSDRDVIFAGAQVVPAPASVAAGVYYLYQRTLA